MSYEIYHWFFIIGALLAGMMLVLSVILFFYFRIPRVIGDLSGSTAKKAIESIRQQNEQTGVKVHRSSRGNLERGKVTAAKMAVSGRIKQQTGTAGAMKTGKLHTQKLSLKAAQAAAETMPLDEPAAETTVLGQPAGETAVLNQPVAGMGPDRDEDKTMLLTQEHWAAVSAPAGASFAPPPASGPAPVQGESSFVIEYEMTLIHSDERIA